LEGRKRWYIIQKNSNHLEAKERTKEIKQREIPFPFPEFAQVLSCH